MSRHTSEPNVTPIDQAAAWSADALTEVLRTGAQRLLAEAVEAEVEVHLTTHLPMATRTRIERMIRYGNRRSTRRCGRRGNVSDWTMATKCGLIREELLDGGNCCGRDKAKANRGCWSWDRGW